MSRPAYRARQLLHALRERREPPHTAFVDRYLDIAGRQLFLLQTMRDQAHSARTAMAVARLEPDNRELIVAALLHDIGKGEQQIWHRIAFVLLGALPGLLNRLARPGTDWRGALERLRTHARTGADMAREAGFSEPICVLIAGHHQPASGGAMRSLQWADEHV